MNENNETPASVSAVFDQPVGDNAYVNNQINAMLERESFRKRVKEVIVEHTDSVPFMKKVQEYADSQIDKRLFKNAKVIVGIIIGWIVTAVIAFTAAKVGH